MALATLSIDLVAKVASFEADLRRASTSAERSARQIESAFGLAKAGVAGLVGALSVRAFTDFFRGTLNGVDALNDLKDATGASIENLSALEDIGARTGTSFESVSASVIKFNKVLSESKAGSETANILKQIGLSAEDLRRLDPAEALRQTAVALSKFADDGNKARLVQILFGRSIAEVAPFLNDLAKQGQLNATITTEQAEATERFNQQLFAVQKNLLDAARGITTDLLPALNDLVEAFRDGGKYVLDMGDGAAALAVPLQALTVLGANVAYVFKETGREIGAIAAQGAALAALDFSRVAAIRVERLADAADARKSLDEFEARVLRLNRLPVADYSNEGRNARPSVGAAAEKDTKAKVSEVDKYIERLNAATLAALELSNVEQVQFDIVSGKLGALTKAQKEQLLGLAEGIDKLRAPADLIGPQIPISVLQERNDAQRELIALIDATPISQLEKLISVEVELKQRFVEGRLSAEQYAQSLVILKKRFEGIDGKELDKLSEAALQAQRNIQNALGDTLKNTLKGDFDSIGKLWGNLLLDMVTQAVAVDLSNALFKGNKAGGSADLFGGFLSLFNFVGGRANGGTVPAGKWAIAGEEGPEPVFGGTTGLTVIPNGGGSGQMNFYTTVNVGEGVSRGQVVAALQASNQALEAKILRSRSRGGAFS